MKNGIVRFAALYVFNVVVLVLIGLLFSRVSVGFHALWAAVILTLAALFVKPALGAAFRRSAAKSAGNRSQVGEKTVQYALVYLVELIIWVLTVWLSAVRASGFWGLALPPLVLLIGWMVYDRFDDRLRAKTAEVYDTVSATLRQAQRPRGGDAPASDSSATAEGRQELNDGLTAEQRRMLDELG